MLERGTKSTTHFAFLISVELAPEGPNTDYVMEKLSDALSWVEGTGVVEIECLGPIDVYDPNETEHAFYEELNKK